MAHERRATSQSITSYQASSSFTKCAEDPRITSNDNGRLIVQNCVTLRASFLAFPVFLRAKRMDCYLLARLARETERLKGVLRMNEPITILDTRHGVPRGGVTPWEQTRRVLETRTSF
jgi:hypothetical protein